MIFDNLTIAQKEKIYSLEYSKTGNPPIDIDKNIFIENEKYVVIEYVKHIIGNNKQTYGYYYIIMCKDCGDIKKVCKSDFHKVTNCKHCNLKKHHNDFIGYENNAYKVIAFDHIQDKKLYYKCICKNCNSILVIRKDNILDMQNTKCAKCKGNGIIPTKKGPINVYKYNYKQGAISRGFEWNLSDDEFEDLIHKRCVYCGEEPKPIQSLKRYTHVKEDIKVNGIDRIDSLKGYTIDNCVPCCTMCNRMKLNYNIHDFIKHIHKISNYYKSSTTIENTSFNDGSELSTLQANGNGNGETPIQEYDIVCSTL